jgi:hypothetical protein
VLKSLLRFWFTFEQSVTRGVYLRHGAALMAIKYATDAILVWLAVRLLWLPTDYIATGTSLAQSKLAGAPAWLPIVLAALTVPFMWVGLTMTSRRALDADVSAWYSLLFFVPIVNYAAIGVLCLLPSASSPEPEPVKQARNVSRRRAMLPAIGAGALVGWVLTGSAVVVAKSYGISLFLGTPFMIGAVSAWVLGRRYPATTAETLATVFLSLVVTGGALLVFAIEGMVCIIMALPFAVGVAWLGSLVGQFLAERDRSAASMLAAVVLLPLTSPLIDSRSPVMVREVQTSIEIAAPPDAVWRNVVTFPRIENSGGLLFRVGIARPVAARIEGSGVGATRYCVFNTGEFVEPITRWEPGRRLSFDVTRNPAPMRELSPYHIEPPHLDGWFRATRGEFRLVALPNGRTRIDGSTWYELDIHPAPYFAVIADYIVGRIHERVLEHIRTVSEK